MSTAIKNVAIAGASGALGAPVTKALLDAGFTVTALTRKDSKSTFPSGVKAIAVDYSSKASLQPALEGQDALISALAFDAADQQEPLIEAAYAAGVQRIIPPEFGSNTLNPKSRALPVFAGRLVLQDLIKRLSDQSGGKFTYTLVFNVAFLDWGVENGVLVNVKEKKFEYLDGGNNYFTSTPLAHIAAGVVAILKNPEATANKAIHLQGARLTPKQFLAIVQRATGTKPEEWTVADMSTKELEKQAEEAFKNHPDNFLGWFLPDLRLSAFGEGYGGDFGEQGEKDNELLGLKSLGEDEVEKLVKSVLQATGI